MKISELLREDENVGTIGNISGDEVTIKKADGTETKTTAKALIPGPDGKTVQIDPAIAAASIKPGTPVTTTISEDEDDDEAAKSSDDLIGSGKDGDIGGDQTDAFINQVIDRDFERSARGSMSPTTKQSRNILPESDELQRWLTIARLR